jgi:hypothetical protein
MAGRSCRELEQRCRPAIVRPVRNSDIFDGRNAASAQPQGCRMFMTELLVMTSAVLGAIVIVLAARPGVSLRASLPRLPRAAGIARRPAGR